MSSTKKTGFERLFERRMKDPKFAREYARAKKGINEVDRLTRKLDATRAHEVRPMSYCICGKRMGGTEYWTGKGWYWSSQQAKTWKTEDGAERAVSGLLIRGQRAGHYELEVVPHK